MLRSLVLIALLANLVLWALINGHIGGNTQANTGDVAANRQINPDKIKVLTEGEFAERLAAGRNRNGAMLCLQSTGNDPSSAAALRDALAGEVADLKLDSIVAQESPQLMVYMGKFPDGPSVDTKLAELERRKLRGDFERIRDAQAWQPGISLGVFRDRERAETRLAEVRKQGVTTARIVERAPGKPTLTLKLNDVKEADRGRLNDALTKAGGRPLAPCAG
jgi:hypothetical protein